MIIHGVEYVSKRTMDEEIQRLMYHREVAEVALTIAASLIPKENLPIGVGPNTVAWLKNQGRKALN